MTRCFELLLLYIAMVPLMSVFPFRVGGEIILLCDLVFLLVFAFWLPTLLSGKVRVHRFEILLLSYLGATLISALVAGAGYFEVVKVLYLVGVAALTRRIGESDPQMAASAWLAGTGLTVVGAFLGVETYYLGWKNYLQNPLLDAYGTLPPGSYPRVNSVFLNSNMLCNYLIVGAALAWDRGTRLLVAGIVGAALYTLSPGLGGLSFVLGWSARRFRGTLMLGLVLTVLSLGAILVSPVDLLEGHLEPSGRLLSWQEALRQWSTHPITGAGPGSAGIEVHYRVATSEAKVSRDAHNVWLSVASQSGGLALGALLALILYSLRKGPSRLPGLYQALRLAVVGAWLIHGLSGSFEDSRHLWVLLGLLEATRDSG